MLIMVNEVGRPTLKGNCAIPCAWVPDSIKKRELAEHILVYRSLFPGCGCI